MSSVIIMISFLISLKIKMLVVWPSVSALTASHQAWRLHYLQQTSTDHLTTTYAHQYAPRTHSTRWPTRPTAKLCIMEAVQWHFVHIHKHQNRTDHWPIHGKFGNTDSTNVKQVYALACTPWHQHTNSKQCTACYSCVETLLCHSLSVISCKAKSARVLAAVKM